MLRICSYILITSYIYVLYYIHTFSSKIYLCYLIVFGPPNVTLKCSADYVILDNKVVEVSWMPSLLTNEASLSTQAINSRVQNCEAGINCSGGYNKPPVSSAYSYM